MQTSLGLLSALCLASFTMLGCSDDAPASPTDTGTIDTGTVDTGAVDTGSPTDTGGPTDTGSGETATDGGTKVDCATYCDKVTANCTGANAQYPSKAFCLNICARFDVGTAADKTGDTLGCRLFHAGEAATDAATSCRRAGMTGGLTCGTDRCATFCKIAIAQCKPSSGLISGTPFTDEADCKTKCAAITFSSTAGEIEQAKGTLNCMQYHLQASYEATDGSSATVHCPHLTTAAGPCKTP
ncbi:MAG: hypothetical protein JNL79_31625 [Myxococcales bacterium]|nr:hypothetical protein [Myxococcales bacterium]